MKPKYEWRHREVEYTELQDILNAFEEAGFKIPWRPEYLPGRVVNGDDLGIWVHVVARRRIHYCVFPVPNKYGGKDCCGTLCENQEALLCNEHTPQPDPEPTDGLPEPEPVLLPCLKPGCPETTLPDAEYCEAHQREIDDPFEDVKPINCFYLGCTEAHILGSQYCQLHKDLIEAELRPPRYSGFGVKP